MCRQKRTLFMGLAILLTLLFASAQLWAQPLGIMSQQPQKTPHKGTLCSDSGRFVFGQISDSSKDQFMLDTQTGRLWRISETGRIGLFLQTVPYKSTDGEYKDLPASSLKPKKKTEKSK
ncbi:MAG: hypothetical protein JRJ51_15600 [Deltaproteobacteria bacterium]|nr:hypothetical protein [Deltaproteobacteria bacterium]